METAERRTMSVLQPLKAINATLMDVTGHFANMKHMSKVNLIEEEDPTEEVEEEEAEEMTPITKKKMKTAKAKMKPAEEE